MNTERFSLKDHLFNESKVAYLAGLLASAVPGFDPGRFTAEVVGSLGDLELKERIAWIARVLGDHLSDDFDEAADQILAALPPPLDPTLSDDDFGDFILAPFGWFVESRGLGHYETSMALLRELTMRVSMEGPVRRFIDQDPERTLAVFDVWAGDANYHVRRLVSESTRPLLPWAPRISLDVRAPIPLLDKLHGDATRYVTRSVANHLNDVSKIDEGLVLETLTRWRATGSQHTDEMDWMTRHALRTLARRGDANALELLGYSSKPRLDVGPLAVATPVVHAGTALEFSVAITSHAEQKLMIDYVIGFARANGSSTKVFKLKKLAMARGETAIVSKRHLLRSDATTYRLYPGSHTVTLVVNGVSFSSADFEVTLS